MKYRTDETVILVVQGNEQQVADALDRVVHSSQGMPIVTGNGDYVAIIYDPPAFPEEEKVVIKELSRRIPGTHYSAWTYAGEEKNLHRYQAGKKQQSNKVDLNEFFVSRGLSILADDIQLDEVIWSAIIWPGGADSVSEVSTLLAESIDASVLKQLVFESRPEGAVIYHPTGDVSMALFPLLEKTDEEVTSCYLKSNGQFWVQLDRPDGEQALFLHPMPEEASEEEELLFEINGKRTPEEIVRSLGLQQQYLPTALRSGKSPEDR